MRATKLTFAICAVAMAQADTFVPGLEAFRRGDYTTAERQFTQSTDTRAKTFLALTQAATSRCKAAEAELERAFQSGPADVARLAGLAIAQCRIAESDFEAGS